MTLYTHNYLLYLIMSIVKSILLRSAVTATAALFCCTLAYAQQTVTGSVVDEFGEP